MALSLTIAQSTSTQAPQPHLLELPLALRNAVNRDLLTPGPEHISEHDPI